MIDGKEAAPEERTADYKPESTIITPDGRQITSYTLRKSELIWCTAQAVERYDGAHRSGKRNTYGLKERDALRVHIHGVCGEYVVSKCLGLDPEAAIQHHTYKDTPDITGPRVACEVRAVTWNASDPAMPIRKNDSPDSAFVMVTMGSSHYDWTVQGWVYGHEVMDERHWWSPNSRSPCWWAETGDLHSMTEPW